MLEAVSFDLWETLITDTPELSRRQERLRLERMEACSSSAALRQTAERIEQAYRALWHRCQELYWSRDEDVACRVQIEHFLEALDLDPATFDEPSLAALEEVYAQCRDRGAAVDGRRRARRPRRTSERGFRLGLISNTGRTPGSALREILDRLGLASSIDAMVFSNEHGVCKPQPSIFEDAPRRARRRLRRDDVRRRQPLRRRPRRPAPRHDRGPLRPARRGTAIAPPVDHGLDIVPARDDRDLREPLE